MKQFQCKNPILKFKEGRKIQKHLWGGVAADDREEALMNAAYSTATKPTVNPNAPKEETIGEWVRERNRSILGSGWRWYNVNLPAGRRAVAMDKEQRVKDANGKEWILKPNGTKVLASLRDRKPAPKVNNANAAVSTGETVPVETKVTTGKVRRPATDYAAKFAGLNLTDDEKKYITEAGFDPTNAKSVQEFILSKAANANLGARKGAGIADGYWGDKSAAAFQALRNQGIFAPKVDAQEKPAPVIEQNVDAPDFGYYSNQDYSNGKAFKGLGFNNYAGLQSFAMAQQDNQFARDLRQRFGDDVSKWDQAYVEQQLGVSGKYRGSNSGDFGDMARSMQAWKNGVNQQFSNRAAEYSRKTMQARTGNDGIVYSDAKTKALFDKAGQAIADKRKALAYGELKLDTTPNFTLKPNTAGVGTLGTGAGTLGVPTEDEYYRMTHPNG